MRVSTQFVVSLLIIGLGTVALGGEYLLVHWYPTHREKVEQRTLDLLPYQNSRLGIEMRVAEGLYGKVQDFPGGVKIYRLAWIGLGPSLTLTSQPNPDQAAAFTPLVLAQWEAAGTQKGILNYRFEHTQIHDRDAAIIWQSQRASTLVTAHIISPDKMIEVDCLSGDSDPALLTQACESSIATIQITGTPTPAPKPQAPGVLRLDNVRIGAPEKPKGH
jgi:hypothetical protein